MAPKISVIIPVYNTGPYLKESVGSIMNQTFHDLEIIVVNDGSTDNSEEVIRELMMEDERILYYKLEYNQGQSVARNEALSHAKGQYIYCMDSDDIIEHEALKRCYEQSERLQLDVLFFDGDILCENGMPSLTWDYHRTERYDEKTVYNGSSLFEDMLLHYTHRAVPWLLLISHEHLKRLSLSFYPGIIHEDELFTSLLFMQSTRIGCLKQNLVKHRVRGNSTMTKRYSLRNINCYLTVVNELFKFAAGKGADMKILVYKYARYTLNPVFNTAKVLPLREKISAIMTCMRMGFLRFLSVRTIVVFFVKK